MKIAIFEPKFLTPTPHAASYLVNVQEQVRTFAKLGHQVLVLTEADQASATEESNLTLCPLKGIFSFLSPLFSADKRYIHTYSALFSPDLSLRAARVLKKMPVDVIYSCGTSFMGVIPALIGRMTGLPTVHYVFQYAGPWKWWRSYIDTFQGFKVPWKYTIMEAVRNSLYQPFRREFIHRWGLRNITQVIASSCHVKESLTKYELKGEHIPVIYPGVDIPGTINTENPKTPLVTYMGHLWQGRGVLDLLKAFAMVAEHYPEAKLVIASTNVNELTERYFESLVDEYGLGPRIVRRGIVEDPGREILDPASVVVLPYRDMPSIKLLEAMGRGKTVVTTNIGWADEIITDSVNGFLVEPGDVGSLATKIEKVLSDRELAIEAGRKAKESVEEKCNRDSNTRATLGILQQAAERAQGVSTGNLYGS